MKLGAKELRSIGGSDAKVVDEYGLEIQLGHNDTKTDAGLSVAIENLSRQIAGSLSQTQSSNTAALRAVVAGLREILIHVRNMPDRKTELTPSLPVPAAEPAPHPTGWEVTPIRGLGGYIDKFVIKPLE